MNEKYKQDFPDTGFFNWKKVKMTHPKSSYYQNCIITGVLLHDGNFMINGVLFYSEEFEIVDEDPLNIEKSGINKKLKK